MRAKKDESITILENSIKRSAVCAGYGRGGKKNFGVGRDDSHNRGRRWLLLCLFFALLLAGAALIAFSLIL